MVETGRCTDLHVAQRTHGPSNSRESSLPRRRLKPLSESSVNSAVSAGDQWSRNALRAALSVRILSMALNLPFWPRTLVPWDRGLRHQTGGIEFSQKP